MSGMFQPLLGDDVVPLLQNLAFVHAERDQSVKAWVDFESPLLAPYGIVISGRTVCGTLNQVVRQLEPLSMPTRERYLFIPCRNRWTLVLDNGAIGSDANSLLHGTVTRTGRRGVRLAVEVSRLKRSGKRQTLAAIWEVVEPSENLMTKTVRSVAVLKEGSWHWDNLGEPFPFEETHAYAAKRVADRFTPDMLKRYGEALGIEAFDESFYLTQNPGAVLLQLSHVPFPNQTNRSLADVQRERFSREDG